MTEPAPAYEGCLWPVDPACFGAEWDAFEQAVQDRALALTSETLRRLTGWRVGGCPITVRPCKAGCVNSPMPYYYGTYPGMWMYPHIGISGTWINSCGCTTDCSCTELCEVELPGPVGEVVEVRVDGTVVPETDYRVDGQRLVWIGAGDCLWPACQDLSKADDQPDTFSVTYLNAYPVDALGAYAAGVLALEFARACNGDACRLPAGVTAVSRQGVAFEIASGAFPDGMTGIREVDTYLALWNPGSLREQPKVWYPGIRSPRVMR